MSVVPDGFLSSAEQELVAVRFFPELSQHTILLSMDGQIKHPGKGKDHARGYLYASGQQEELSHLGRECEVQLTFLIPDLLLSGGGLDLVRGVKYLCQRLGELGVSAKQLRVVGLELLLLLPLHSLLLLAKSVQLRQIPFLIEIAGLKWCAALFQNGDSSLLATKHRDPLKTVSAGFQFQEFTSIEQGFQLRLMLVPPVSPGFGCFSSLSQIYKFCYQCFFVYHDVHSSQSHALPAVQPLLHRVDHPNLAHTLHEETAVKAGIFLSGVDVELVLGDLLRVKEFFPVVGALGTV